MDDAFDPRLSAGELAAFMSRVDQAAPSGCWVWTAGRDRDGYGRFTATARAGRPKRTMGAHRVAFAVHVQPVPAGSFVLHRCDNPSCVNPSHLFLGTQAENMSDMTAKGRRVFGRAHGRAKITEADVREIRRSPLSGRALAKVYGIGQTQVRRVKSGRAWAHVI